MLDVNIGATHRIGVLSSVFFSFFFFLNKDEETGKIARSSRRRILVLAKETQSPCAHAWKWSFPVQLPRGGYRRITRCFYEWKRNYTYTHTETRISINTHIHSVGRTRILYMLAKYVFTELVISICPSADWFSFPFVHILFCFSLPCSFVFFSLRRFLFFSFRNSAIEYHLIYLRSHFARNITNRCSPNVP